MLCLTTEVPAAEHTVIEKENTALYCQLLPVNEGQKTPLEEAYQKYWEELLPKYTTSKLQVKKSSKDGKNPPVRSSTAISNQWQKSTEQQQSMATRPEKQREPSLAARPTQSQQSTASPNVIKPKGMKARIAKDVLFQSGDFQASDGSLGAATHHTPATIASSHASSTNIPSHTSTTSHTPGTDVSSCTSTTNHTPTTNVSCYKSATTVSSFTPAANEQESLPKKKLHQQSKLPLSTGDPLETSKTCPSFKHNHQSVDILKAELTQENYRKKFHQLLRREEREHRNILSNRCNGKYRLTIREQGSSSPNPCASETPECVRYGYITAKHLDGDKIAYAEQSSGGKLTISCNKLQIFATMILVPLESKGYDHELSINLSMSNSDAIKLPDFKKSQFVVPLVEVTFELKYSYFKRLHMALDLLSQHTIERLVPSSTYITSREESKGNNRRLGKDRIVDECLLLDGPQMNALRVILSAKPELPVIVVGSFGTGKTRLLARAAFEIVKNNTETKKNRVLICAHHQKSADSFLETYFGKMAYRYNWRVNMVRMIVSEDNQYRKWYSQYRLTADRICFNTIELMVTTFGNVLHLKGKVEPGFFTHILMDEGAQTREPENIAPLFLCGPQTVIVIAGDHKQVGPSILVLDEEAQEYGLKISLLERLHALYTKEKEDTSHLCATLLTNYRCHRALLALPSYLFYESTLITNSNSKKQPKLYPLTSSPVHFICSSFDDTVLEVKESTNDREAILLLDKAVEVVDNWSQEWDDIHRRPVCIMSTTSNQNSLMHEMIWNSYRGRLDIGTETLTVYNMQGREFQCVFLSTAEPTTAEGASKNPTKTPCSQYVFNTALTRAKSLVVCAGNPFLLMKIEKMTKNTDERPFWAEYIRCCMENDTFVIPDSLCMSNKDRQEKISKLREIIFTYKSHTCYTDPLKVDSITEAYKKCCQMRLRYTRGGVQWRIINSGTKDEQEESNPAISLKGAFLCNLETLNYRMALAHPLDSSKPVVTLSGLRNRQGALDGDLVLVSLYDSGKDVGVYGKVVQVQQKCHKERYVCRMDQYNTILFHPIDRKSPTFVNLPKLSRLMMNFSKQDIEAGFKSQRDWVVIFDEDSLQAKSELELPKIRKIISAETARNLLFVVREVCWNPKYRLPLGAVVESLPLGTNSFHAERLLIASYSMFEDELDEELYEERNETVKINDSVPTDVVCQAFTIDPSEAHNLDDAISLVQEGNNTYTMSVLIPVVGGQVAQGSSTDIRAQARATSVYGIFRNMLPAVICNELSLSPMRIRDVWIISAKITIGKDDRVTDTSNAVIRKGKVQSQIRLDYFEAQCLLKREISDSLQEKIEKYSSISKLRLPDSLEILFKIAMHMRVQRLGQAAYACNISEEEDKKSWQAHLLVEELMVWANSTVAECVIGKMPRFAVLRRQVSPSVEKVKQFQRIFAGVIGHSVSLSALCNTEPEDALLVPHSTMQQLQKAMKERDLVYLQCLLTLDCLYPQLSNASSSLRKIKQRAEYVCSNRFHSLLSTDIFRHQSLCLDYYTHFTSPIRRYCDIVVQRLLESTLNNQANAKCSYTVEQLEKLCQHFNIRSQEVNQFQREAKRLKFALKLGESCEETQAYVHRNESRFAFSFPELKYQSCLKLQNAEFHISTLGCIKDESEFLTWKASMFSFQGNNFILNNHKLCNFQKVAADERPAKNMCEFENTMVKMTVFYWPAPLRVANCTSEDEESEGQDRLPSTRLHKMIEGQDRLLEFQLSSTQTHEMLAINGAKWQSIVKNIANLSEDTILQLSDALPKLEREEQCTQVHTHTTTVERFKASPILKYMVRRKLGSNSIVPVWLGQTLVQEPILTSCLQLMEVAPELRVCLQHNAHPAECFSDPHFGQASQGTYSSLNEYVSLWEKVYLAEVAQDSVLDRSKPLTILKDVFLRWQNLKIPENSWDTYFIPRDPVELKIPYRNQQFLQYNIHIDVGDLVCVRYNIEKEQCKAVYHLVVSKVYKEESNKEEDNKEGAEQKEEKKSKIFEMKPIGKNSCQISSKMADILTKHSNPPTCELQIVNLQVSYNRVYKVMASLKQLTGTESHRKSWKVTESHGKLGEWKLTGKERLVCLVARGDIKKITQRRMSDPLVKKVLEVFRTDRMAYTLWRCDIELNDGQMKAIKKALTNCFHLIQGPPGTGKSETGAHIAYIFAQLLEDHQCVVYCAPSNKAVDVVHEKLLEANKNLGSDNQLKLLRLYGRTHERIDFPGPHTSHGFLPSVEGEGKCLPKFQKYALHHHIRKQCPRLEEMEAKFDKMYKEEKAVPTPELLKEYNKLISKMEKHLIGERYDIILATCNECAGHRLSKLRKLGRVAQVIVDECGMAHEPDTIAAVSLSEHVVLIGDHKQLQPVVKLTAARENGLSTSLFQRYAENFKEKCPLTTLTLQYRMHTKICEFPSAHFYDSKLRPHSSVTDRHSLPGMERFWTQNELCYPIVFCDIDGEEEEESGSSKGRKSDPHSKLNFKEATKAVEIAQVLRRILQDEQHTIAILTPYRAQKIQIENKMQGISVFTINESQGDEYDYVILTTVRSQPLNEIRNPDLVQPDKRWLRENLGFLTDEHQINVAITRAKRGLIIVGNLTLLSYDKGTWEPLIQFYRKNNCIVEACKFPRKL